MIILATNSPKLVALMQLLKATHKIQRTFFCAKTVILDGCNEIDVMDLRLQKPVLAFYLRSLPLACHLSLRFFTLVQRIFTVFYTFCTVQRAYMYVHVDACTCTHVP